MGVGTCFMDSYFSDSEFVRIFSGKFPEGIFWGLFLVFCGSMLLIHFISPAEFYFGATLGKVHVMVYIAIILVLYGVRFLLKGWISSVVNIVLICLFGFWVFGMFHFL